VSDKSSGHAREYRDLMKAELQALIDRGRIHPVQVRVVALCALVTLVEGIDLTLIPLLAPAIATSWSLEPAQLGIIFSTGAFGLIFGGLGVGWLADRIGRRGALMAAMVLMTASTLVTAWVTSVPQLLVCRLLAGVAFGGVIPAAVSLVSEFLPERTRASVVALVILGQALGALLAALLLKLPWLAAQPWQQLVLYAGLACAVVTLLLALLPESPRYLALRAAGSARLAAVLGALRIDPAQAAFATEQPVARFRLAELFAPGRAYGTALLWVTFIGVGWPLSFFTNWLTKIHTQAGHAASVGVDAMALYSGGAIAGGLLLPLLSRRWQHERVLMATLLAAAVVTVALGAALQGAMALHMTVSFLCGVFVSGAFFLLYPPAVRFYPTDMRSTGIGAAVAFGRIGNTFSPTVAGLMLGAGLAPKVVFWAMAAPLLMSCLAMYLFHRLTSARAGAGVVIAPAPAST
jgi:AAHS family 4-hydroxybenzoate transporter-like MFS transporter